MEKIEINGVEYVNVPVYIEKAVKKLYRLSKNMKEVKSQIRDYLESHKIPTDIPLDLLKNFDEETDPNQMKLEL